MTDYKNDNKIRISLPNHRLIINNYVIGKLLKNRTDSLFAGAG